MLIQERTSLRNFVLICYFFSFYVTEYKCVRPMNATLKWYLGCYTHHSGVNWEFFEWINKQEDVPDKSLSKRCKQFMNHMERII